MNDTLMKRIWQGFWVVLPLYPWFNTKTKQVYSRSVFREMIDTGTPWKMLFDMLEDFQNLRNKYYEGNLGNHEWYLVREDKRFKFGIYLQCDEFSLWDDFDQFLGRYKIDKDSVPTIEFCEWIEKLTEDYCKGMMPCSDCGKMMSKGDMGGRYFAGIYCKDCWSRKWKAIEAKETYN